MTDQVSSPSVPGAASVVPVLGQALPSDATRDPIRTMIEIAKDPQISDDDKKQLIAYANNRFQNRRRMAYISLWTIVVSLAFVGAASAIDGISGSTSISDRLAGNDTIISFALAFLTGVVAAYYGMSAWRPSS